MRWSSGIESACLRLSSCCELAGEKLCWCLCHGLPDTVSHQMLLTPQPSVRMWDLN